MASRAFYQILRGYSDPSRATVERTARLADYDLFWAYYQNSVFDRTMEALWTRYKTDQRLVSYLRSLYNPTAKLVDFYVGAVYPGVMAADGEELPGGIPLAVPLAKDTDPKLKGAVGQLLRWSNWQTQKDLYVMYGGAVGDVALKIADDVDRSKVLILPIWPGHIVDLERDDEGNVTFYAMEYETTDKTREGGQTTEDRYTYREEVDRDTIRYFKDGSPHDYGDGQAPPNPYGFVPLVWVQHRNRGGDHGAPAIAGSLPAIEAINHVLSIVLKDIERVSRSPKVIATSSQLGPALSPEAQTMLAQAEISLDLLKGNPDTTTHDLGTNLDLANVLEGVAKLIGFVEQAHPEITFYEKLREMSQVTGPAARRLVGDSQANVLRAAGGYDDGLMRACQMGISVAAIRRTSRQWKRDTDAQKAFDGFTPESFDSGALNFEIMPRVLIEDTPTERWEAEKARAIAATAWFDFMPSKVFALDRVGFTEADLQKWIGEKADLIRKERLLAASDLDPDGEPPPEQ